MRSMSKVTLALGGLGASWSIADSHNRVRLATSQQPPALTLWECPVGGFSSNLAGLKVAGHLTRDHGRRAQSAAETYFVCFPPSLTQPPFPWWQTRTKSSSVVRSRSERVRSSGWRSETRFRGSTIAPSLELEKKFYLGGAPSQESVVVGQRTKSKM